MLKNGQRPTKAFWAAYSGLYGNEVMDIPPKKRKKPKAEERREQTILCDWMDENGILFYSVPNGSKRNPIEGYLQRRSGLKRGVPDLCLPIARKGHHGLYIELKRISGGVVSPEQKEWLEKLTAEGYLAKVANGAEEAKKIVRYYLGIA